MIRVRAVEPDEWTLWRDLRLRALADSPDAFGETLPFALTRDDASWMEVTSGKVPGRCPFIAFFIGRPIGMALLKNNRPRADLYAMWVDPEARDMGAGQALLIHAIGLARGNGAIELALRVSELQTAAEWLYRKHGFVDTGEQEPLRTGSTVQSRHMVLRL